MRDGKFLVLIGLIVAVLLIGTFGYVQIEGMRLMDALYMAAITVTTVGFNEVQPLSDTGRLFTIALMFLGIGIVVYAITLLSGRLIEPAIHLGRKRTLEDAELLSEEANAADTFEFMGNRDKLVMAPLTVARKSSLANRKKLDILKEKSIVVIGVKDKQGNFRTDVPFESRIRAGDVVLVMGTADQIKKLR